MNINKIRDILIRHGIYIIGILIMAFGLGLLTAQTNVRGAFPIESFCLNLEKIFAFKSQFLIDNGFTIILFCFNSFFIIPLAILQYFRHKLDYKVLLGIIPALILAIPESFFYSLFQNICMDLSIVFQYLLFIFGAFISCIGVGIFQVTNLYSFSNMELIEVIGIVTKKPFARYKIINDLSITVALLITILILGWNNSVKVITVETIALAILPGLIINITMNVLRKVQFIQAYRPEAIIHKEEKLELSDEQETNITHWSWCLLC